MDYVHVFIHNNLNAFEVIGDFEPYFGLTNCYFFDSIPEWFPRFNEKFSGSSLYYHFSDDTTMIYIFETEPMCAFFALLEESFGIFWRDPDRIALDMS